VSRWQYAFPNYIPYSNKFEFDSVQFLKYETCEQAFSFFLGTERRKNEELTFKWGDKDPRKGGLMLNTCKT